MTPCPAGVRVGSPGEQDGQASQGVVLRPLQGCGGTSGETVCAGGTVLVAVPLGQRDRDVGGSMWVGVGEHMCKRVSAYAPTYA